LKLKLQEAEIKAQKEFNLKVSLKTSDPSATATAAVPAGGDIYSSGEP